MQAHVAALLEEAQHLVAQTWPGPTPPPPIRDSLRRLARTAGQLDAAVARDGEQVDAVELRRLTRLSATATEDAASIQEAAFLVSS
jgi:hypothetical protein